MPLKVTAWPDAALVARLNEEPATLPLKVILFAVLASVGDVVKVTALP